MSAFFRHCLGLSVYDFVWGLQIDTLFVSLCLRSTNNGLDLVLRPQLCQEHKLQIGFLFCSGLMLKCVVVTCTEKVSLCVTGVYVREMTDTSFLHLNVSGC